MQPLTDAEADGLLAKLTEHFREPVMPVSRYCAALSTWRALRVQQSLTPDSLLRSVETAIRKSNLLYRMIYCGEKPRTVECPAHKGHWNGPATGCAEGCGGTGWLPEPRRVT